MKNSCYLLFIGLFVYACASTKDKNMDDDMAKKDTVRIANDSLDYEVIIFEPGFDTWLVTQLPIESYSTEYLEAKNRRMIAEYNRRAMNPMRYGSLYPITINYDPNVHYGKKVNYMLYNYLEYFQEKYNQRL
ncbi:MAG TPA: DUF6146 family protein [Flavobacteriaceae bacterium]|nr:DUF6146 family protein [Flavobacteriaceae bacterium]